jgi:hypothetical protein
VIVVVGALAVWLTTTQPFEWSASGGRQSEQLIQTFVLGDAASLRIDNFAGEVIVRAGESGTARLTATKEASRGTDLERIEVDVSQSSGGLVITTRKPSALTNASVDLEVIVPSATSLDVDTGAGEIRIEGIRGEIQVDSGAGEVHLENASGPVRVQTGAGGIRYEGTPQGQCRFESGVGDIQLVLPNDLNASVDLHTGIGNVDVAFPVAGQASGRNVQGTIGTGADAEIYAQTGAGDINVDRR